MKARRIRRDATGRRVARRGLWALAFLAISAALSAPASAATSCPEADETIVVRVKHVRSAGGNVAAELYGDNPDAFLKKGKKIIRVRVPARKGVVEICLPTPRPGAYAVVVYHDENDNKKFDRSWLGLPKEGYGVSNDAKGFFGPPAYADAAFETEGDQTVIDITLGY